MIIAGMDSQLERYIILIRFCFFFFKKKTALVGVVAFGYWENIGRRENLFLFFGGIGLVAGKRGGNEILEFDFFLLVLICLVIEKMVGRK